MPRFLPRALAALPALLLPAALTAQSLRAQTGPRQPAAPGAPTQIVSINPFMPLLGWFAGEYERRVHENLSFAVAGSYLEYDNAHYTNLDAKLRLYPQERALEGLGLAAGLGVGHIRRNDPFCGDYYPADGVLTGCRRTETAPSFSVEGQYQWQLGERRATVVTMGAGVKRYFVNGSADGGLQKVVPTLRLTVGYGFR